MSCEAPQYGLHFLPDQNPNTHLCRIKKMDLESCVPPGFRFHPTEEELIGYYLKRKINSLKIDLDVITDIDLYRMEPWDIEGRCKLGYEEQKEWYFFSHKDRKYPTGTRTNRATTAGFWKATGRDKAVLSKEKLIGMRKTLVFYKGRAPNGRKTDWIMHEYRHQTSELGGPNQEEGWVVCRAFKKPNPSHKQGFEAWNYYIRNEDENNNSSNNMTSNIYRHPSYNPIHNNFNPSTNQLTNSYKQPPFPAMGSPFENQLIELPKLDHSPPISTSFVMANEDNVTEEDDRKGGFGDQFYNWKSFDKLVASSSSSSSYVYPNMSLGQNSDDELLDAAAHNNLSYVLECFPDGL